MEGLHMRKKLSHIQLFPQMQSAYIFCLFYCTPVKSVKFIPANVRNITRQWKFSLRKAKVDAKKSCWFQTKFLNWKQCLNCYSLPHNIYRATDSMFDSLHRRRVRARINYFRSKINLFFPNERCNSGILL